MNKLDQLKSIVDDHQVKEIDGYMVDVQTANIILQVYEALSDENKEKFINQEISSMSMIAWKLIN